MQRIAQFYKVSEEQFMKDMDGMYVQVSGSRFIKLGESDIRQAYRNIELPRRATSGSAGYDFFSPVSFMLKPGESILMPTGIRARIDDGWVLKLYPRSGFGFKYRLQLDNTVGIIDADYFSSDNEGHIMAKLTNCSMDGKILKVPEKMGFVQGIFLPFGVTVDDDVDAVRNGGFGSTSNK